MNLQFSFVPFTSYSVNFRFKLVTIFSGELPESLGLVQNPIRRLILCDEKTELTELHSARGKNGMKKKQG